MLAEVLFDRARPALVVGCFSTALFTASSFYGLPVARIGTDSLLERLVPYQNSNRVPLVLADALLPDLEDLEDLEGLRRPGGPGGPREPPDTLGAEAVAELLAAVGFVMQPQLHPGLRPVAERYLRTRLGPRTRRYFRRRRLTSLGLPGGIPQRLAFLPRHAAGAPGGATGEGAAQGGPPAEVTSTRDVHRAFLPDTALRGERSYRATGASRTEHTTGPRATARGTSMTETVVSSTSKAPPAAPAPVHEPDGPGGRGGPAGPGGPEGRLRALDGLRLVAALMVAVYHYARPRR